MEERDSILEVIIILNIIFSDIVVSVAGVNNELLTMTTPMIKNAYKGLYFILYDDTYRIASNDTSVITLETPTTSYDDLTGETIGVIQNYTTKAKIIRRIPSLDANKLLTNSGALEEMMIQVDAKINEYLGISKK